MRHTLLALLLLAACGKDDKDPSGAGGAAKEASARAAVRAFALEAYPRWSLDHPLDRCARLEDLARLANQRTEDPWGNPYVVLCGDTAPPGVTGMGVLSLGPDGKQGTPDDIKSWE